MRLYVMSIFLFLRFYNFSEGTMRIYIIFFKKLRPWFLYLTYELVYFQLLTELMYLCLNKLTSKYGKGIVLIFIYTV